MSESTGRTAPPSPVPLAFLICDQVITDEVSKKRTVVGIFDTIWIGAFPTNYRPAALYVRLTDAEGAYKARIEYVQVASQKILATIEASVEVTDRLMPAEFSVPLPPIPIPSAGEYEFRLWLNDKYVHRVRFNARPKSN